MTDVNDLESMERFIDKKIEPLNKQISMLQIELIGIKEVLPIDSVTLCFSAEETERINEYARNQYNRGQLDLPLVSFDEWVNKA